MHYVPSGPTLAEIHQSTRACNATFADGIAAASAATVTRQAIAALRALPAVASCEPGVHCPHQLADDLEDWAEGFDYTAILFCGSASPKGTAL